jgi:hypothetical protein
LLEAWERLRETATEFGEQRIYASHNSIMFSRKACYFCIRPKKEVPRDLFLPRTQAEDTFDTDYFAVFKTQDCSPRSRHSPGSSETTADRLA